MNLSGGNFTASAFTLLSDGNGDTSTINIGGTAVVTLPAFPPHRHGLDGDHQLQRRHPEASRHRTAYMGGLTNAFIKVGGAQFDTTNGSITITQNLLTDTVSTGGGLSKLGDEHADPLRREHVHRHDDRQRRHALRRAWHRSPMSVATSATTRQSPWPMSGGHLEHYRFQHADRFVTGGGTTGGTLPGAATLTVGGDNTTRPPMLV